MSKDRKIAMEKKKKKEIAALKSSASLRA